MSSEPEMTKETTSGCTPLSIFYRSPRLMQVLSLLSGFGILSSGLVMAQTDTPVDTLSAPKNRPVAPTVKVAPYSLPPEPAAKAKPVTKAQNVELAAPVGSKPVRKPVAELAAPAASKPASAPSVVLSTPAARKPLRDPDLVLAAPAARKPARSPSLVLAAPAARQPASAPSVVLVAPAVRQPVRDPSLVLAAPVARKPASAPSVVLVAPVARQPVRDPRLVLAAPVARKPVPYRAASVPSRVLPPVSVTRPNVLPRIPEAVVQKRSVLEAPDLSIADTLSADKPPQISFNPAQMQEIAKKRPISPTNTYIDRTGYSIGATRRYEGPSAVSLTERSTGCQTISSNGQLSSGVCGITPPSLQIPSQQMANSGRTVPILQTPNAERTVPVLQTANSGRTLLILQTANSGRSLPGLKTPSSGRTLPSLQIASSGSTLPSLQTPSSGSTLPSLQTDAGSTLPNLETANPGPTDQEPRLLGVPRLPTPPAVIVGSVKPSPAGVSSRGMSLPGPKTYSAYIPNTSTNSTYSPPGSTAPMGLDYYQLTAPPAGRPSIGKDTFMFPLTLPSTITSLFGWRIHPMTGEYRFHTGTDLGAPEGTPVIAAVSGQVVAADFLGGYGLTVVLQHDQGMDESLYAHMSEIFVRPGDMVEQGNVIGRVGSTGNATGPHLHFEWRHLTPDGWVAVDAGAHLEYSLAQFITALQIAQAAPQRGF